MRTKTLTSIKVKLNLTVFVVESNLDIKVHECWMHTRFLGCQLCSYFRSNLLLQTLEPYLKFTFKSK